MINTSKTRFIEDAEEVDVTDIITCILGKMTAFTFGLERQINFETLKH
jgi:hypothetical protein